VRIRETEFLFVMQAFSVLFLDRDLTMKLIVTRRMMTAAALLVSGFVAACGPHSKNTSTETLTIYEDAPALQPLDLGPPGNSLGDAYYFSAPLHSSPGGPVTGEVFGSKTLVKLAAQANSNSEKRQRFWFSPFMVVRIRLSRSVLAIIRLPPPNSIQANRSCARYWVEPASLSERVAN
jgi:hypothetical protein